MNSEMYGNQYEVPHNVLTSLENSKNLEDKDGF